jgi:nucleoid DNA-binding protein
MNKITKPIFADLVCRKFKKLINPIHVRNVVMLFWQEFQSELLENKKIEIKNFASINYQQLPPRKHPNVFTGQMEISPGHHKITFKLNEKLGQYLRKNLDIDRTFPNR